MSAPTNDSRTLFLVQPRYTDRQGPTRDAAAIQFPLGLGYIASYAKSRGYRVRLFDPNVQEIDDRDIARTVAGERPLLVGVSFMTSWFSAARKLCELVKESSRHTPIVVGGIHPTVLPEQTMRDMPGADFLVMGEGEQATVELMEALETGKGEFRGIDGLVWRRDGETVRNRERAPIENLDALPFPDRSLVDQRHYRLQSYMSHHHRFANLYTSRGCPGRCTFCCSGHRLRSRIRTRSIENVMEEVEHLRQRYGVRYLVIKDDTFTLDRRRVDEFCRAIRRYRDIRWHCMGRVNAVDRDMLIQMKEAGLTNIVLGIESGNEEILRATGKGITTVQARAAVEAAARAGIASVGAFIIGLPGETRQTAEDTIRFACEIPLTMAIFATLIPYPGTRVFEEHVAIDPSHPLDFDEFVSTHGLKYVKQYTGMKGLRVEELPGLISEAQRRFYLRPRQVARMLRFSSPSMLRGYLRGAGALLQKEIRRRSAHAGQEDARRRGEVNTDA